MNRTVTQMREIEIIEKELIASHAGVLVLHLTDDKFVQVTCTFLYYHKNIYADIQGNDEILEKIIYDNNVSFTIIKSEKSKSPVTKVRKIVSVTLNGNLKRPEEVKITEEIKDLYSIKYSGSKSSDDDPYTPSFLMVDTSEIKAYEEVFG